MMRSEKHGNYEERFCSFSKPVERIFVYLVLGLVLSLISSQLLLSNDTFRHWFIIVDRLEGVAS
jgi:hypothetical protein